jgi:hypothetical protein
MRDKKEEIGLDVYLMRLSTSSTRVRYVAGPLIYYNNVKITNWRDRVTCVNTMRGELRKDSLLSF